MIVTQAQVDLTSSHQYRQTRSQSESLQLFKVNADGQAQQQIAVQEQHLSLSAQAVALARRVDRQDNDLREAFDTANGSPPPGANAVRSAPAPVGSTEEPELGSVDGKTLMIKAIIEHISGKSLQLFDATRLDAEKPDDATPESSAPATMPETPPTGAEGTIGMRYQRSEFYNEQETTRFAAQARVKTVDGRTLDFNLDLQMSRQFAEQSQLVIEAGAKLKDPLVINFDQRAVTLTDQRYDFDLDADGVEDSIAFVDSHSGLLALDRNNDGRINDGSELFGARSGNGFADLSAFDEDGNGFIDEGDSVFNDLRLWIKEDGEDRLTVLADQGIGAIYLGYADTPFELKDQQNQLQGRIRATGVYLNESGGGGSVQQIDLVT